MLTGKIAVITGGGSGIGRATAVEMARQEARAVVIADVNDEGGAETVRLTEEAGAEAIYVRCDVRESAQIRELMTTAGERYGRIDILINNAGVQETSLTEHTSIDTLPEEVWDTVAAINLKALWLCTKFALPYLRRSDAGAIVNAGSLGALVAYPMNAVYGATKAGVAGLTRSMALDLAVDGIRCNCYHPAAIHTPMMERYLASAQDREAVERQLAATHLVPRLGEPEDVAKLSCFLASDDASFITGSEYVIDGGATAWRGSRDV